MISPRFFTLVMYGRGWWRERSSVITRICTLVDYFFSTSVPFGSSINNIITEEPQEKALMWEMCAPALF